MAALDLNSNLVGARIILELSALRPHYQRVMGRARGDAAVDRLPVDGWRCVFDDRADGGRPCIIIAYTKPDGNDLTSCMEMKYIRSAYPARTSAET